MHSFVCFQTVITSSGFMTIVVFYIYIYISSCIALSQKHAKGCYLIDQYIFILLYFFMVRQSKMNKRFPNKTHARCCLMLVDH